MYESWDFPLKTSPYTRCIQAKIETSVFAIKIDFYYLDNHVNALLGKDRKCLPLFKRGCRALA